ncbi:MAG TPA: flavodoxin family protein [Dehalococcoidia bacterium]|nr:flavodoxin family protein [Dehalococcoidia bacterium]
MVAIKLLGISATPIKGGNCDALVQEALKTAQGLGDVDTEFVTLADKEVAMCRHCQWCIQNRAPCKIEDDYHSIVNQILGSDGLILGAPTWSMTLSPPLLNLWSRFRYFNFFTADLRNKVVGALTLGWFGFGMDKALDVIETLAGISMMLPVARAGAVVSTAAFGQRAAYMEHGVLDDTLGMARVRAVAERVVEVARMIKYAKEAGIMPPPDQLVTLTGAHLKPAGKKVFIDGVWRDKE